MIPLFRQHQTKIPEIILSSKNVLVRPPSLNDENAWINVRTKNKARLKPFEPTWANDALTADFFKRKLARQTHDWLRDQNYAFLIFTKQSDLIGGININHVSRGAAQFASLGYWIDSDHEGKGAMRRALELVIEFAFDDLRLHRMNAATLIHNDRSRNLLLRLGFSEEGRAANYIQIDGAWQDHILFGRNRNQGETSDVQELD
jgi:[ribosomal protein S5]-alanine N-acetyltransferase